MYTLLDKDLLLDRYIQPQDRVYSSRQVYSTRQVHVFPLELLHTLEHDRGRKDGGRIDHDRLSMALVVVV